MSMLTNLIAPPEESPRPPNLAIPIVALTAIGSCLLFWLSHTTTLILWIAVLAALALLLRRAEWDKEGARRELLESERRYRMLADHLPDVIWQTDLNLRVVYVNPAVEALLGYSPEEFIGAPLESHFPPDRMCEIRKILERELHRLDRHSSIVFETAILHRQGHEIPIEVRGCILLDPQGRPTGIQGTAHDIAARRHAEEHQAGIRDRLMQAQRLEAIGTLASGVAHEINNPIMGVMGYAQLIAAMGDGNAKLTAYAAQIDKDAQRIASIVRNLLNFSRRDKPPLESRCLAEVVDDAFSLLGVVMRHDRIIVDVEVPRDLPPVLCRAQQIQQVVMNLMTNARDAVNEKAARAPGAEKRITLRAQPLETESGRMVRMIVEDSGTGIPPDVRGRIFTPFFTTKPDGQGTGLGLSISQAIVKEHGGAITVASEPGRFTRFSVDLPVGA